MNPGQLVYAKSRVAVIGLVVLTWTCGCMVGPDYRPPQMHPPSRFLASSTQPSTTQPTTQSAEVVNLERWWESFHDPELDRLIADGIASNLDVQLAQARVLEARANLQGNVATLFPTADSSASYSRNQFSKNGFGSIGGIGSGSSSGAGATPAAFGLPGTRTNLYQAGFDAGWEVDVFGGTRRAIEAAQASLQAQVDARRNAMITFLGAQRLLQDWEQREPDLTEHLLEGLSDFNRQLALLAALPKLERRLIRRMESLILVLLAALRRALLRQWESEEPEPAGGDPPASGEGPAIEPRTGNEGGGTDDS